MGVLCRASMHPPAHRGGGAGLASGPRPGWILLDMHAYVADRRNSTTATCPFKGSKELQVTFYPAHPPRVSYFCVHCSGLKSDAYAVEPKIIATDGNLVLFCVVLGSSSDVRDPSAYEYFIYRADGGGTDGRTPLLEQLPHPMPYVFHHTQVGLLSHGGAGYTIVALRDDSSAIYREDVAPRPGHYDVCILDSRDKVWTIKPVNATPQEQQKRTSTDRLFYHATSKVITIGGERGTMAFVDLCRGILLYDVFVGSPLLRYTPLPEICPGMTDYDADPWFTRDISFIEGRIKYVEMVSTGSDGWKAATWSMPVSTSGLQDKWLPPCELEACDICDDKNLVWSELLPKLNYKKGESQPTLASLDMSFPTLSLSDDDIVYFMTRGTPLDTKACMIAVDMKSQKLERVAELPAGRTTLDVILTLTQSRISSYLKLVPGMISGTKKRNMTLLKVGLPYRPVY